MDENARPHAAADAKQVMYQALVSVGAELGRGGREMGPERRQHHHQLQGQRCADLISVYAAPGAAL